MSGFTPIRLNDAFVEALDGKTAYYDPRSQMIQVRPPEQNNGLSASKDLLRSFHDYQKESAGLFGYKNASDITGFEVWYDQGELQFLYYLPSKEREEHYRRQIDGHFRGCKVTKFRDRFPTVNEGDYITGGEVWLNNHHFEPIRKENGVEEWDDPYLMLFSEMDTRDDTRTMLQIMFRPAEEDWTRTMFESVDDYAEGIRGDYTSSKFFGLINETRSATEEEQEYAGHITRQAGHPAFYVNIRYLVISPTHEDAVEQANNLAVRLDRGYREITGQTLATDPASSPQEVSNLIRKMAARETENMEGRRTLWSDFKRAKFGDPTRQMIMTIPEIAGLMHFPKAKEVDLPSISWTDIPINGTLPHTSKDFERLTPSERLEQLQRWDDERDALFEELGLDKEEQLRLFNHNPRNKHAEERERLNAESQQTTSDESTAD